MSIPNVWPFIDQWELYTLISNPINVFDKYYLCFDYIFMSFFVNRLIIDSTLAYFELKFSLVHCLDPINGMDGALPEPSVLIFRRFEYVKVLLLRYKSFDYWIQLLISLLDLNFDGSCIYFCGVFFYRCSFANKLTPLWRL